MESKATKSFWKSFRELPREIQKLTVKQYRLWLSDLDHPSVNFKPVGRFWSARISEDYRAVGVREGNTVIWFFIGTHTQYDRLLNKR